jgi:hypothetical protein
MLLDKDTILKRAVGKKEKVDHPEGGHVFLRALPMTDLDEFESENYVFDGKTVKFNRRDYRARLLIRAICDEEGKPLFTLKDIGALGKKSGPFLHECFKAAQRLNGLVGEEEVEQAVKNSEAAPGGDSVSA